MKLFHTAKDGGPDSNVTGYWLIEWKRGFSIALLRFGPGTRDAYHEHAFDSVSWLLKGGLRERIRYGFDRGVFSDIHHKPSWKPIVTQREVLHKVFGLHKANWVLTFRGPWVDTWRELRRNGRFVTLTHGRKVV
jgi:hypothetical protein